VSNHIIKGNQKPFQGSISVPGDKSISHRAIILSSLAKGGSVIEGLLKSGDVYSTINAFRKMGIHIEEKEYLFHVGGKGLHGLRASSDEIDAGNSGTTARLLTGLLSAQKFNSTISGDEYLKKRPMRRVVDPLRLMGADITGAENGDKLPLRIRGKKLKGINYALPVASAQVKSSLMLAGLYAEGNTVITEPEKSRDHTERMLDYFGIKFNIRGRTIEISRPEQFHKRELKIPADISSAAFFIVGALINKDSEIVIRNVGLNPARTGILDILNKMNANIRVINSKQQCGEPVGDLLVGYRELYGTEIRGEVIPRMIDELPVLAVAACFAEGETVIRDAGELRVKETDRIEAMSSELNKLGADITPLRDGMIIEGGKSLKASRCRSWGDHRIAMSVAIAATRAEGETEIRDSEYISISFPDFFNILDKLRS